MNGWRLVGLLSLLLTAMSLWLLAGHAGDVEGIRLVIRATARTSLVLFVMAFTAGALVELIPSDATRWQRRNRRYLGVSFAVSHFIHLAAIVGLAALDRELSEEGGITPLDPVTISGFFFANSNPGPNNTSATQLIAR